MERAIGRFLEARGYQILRHRWQTPFGELDFLVKTPKGFVGLEVKTLRKKDRVDHRVSRSQLKRLSRIHCFLSEKMGPTAFYVVFARPQEKLRFLELSSILEVDGFG